MSWIKRNLYFVIGSFVAVVLMGMAVFYLFRNLGANSQAFTDWNQAYSDLKALQDQNPHPGDAKVNNIKIAQEQCDQFAQLLKQARANFAPIQAIPSSTTFREEDFAKQLRTTINHLHTQARESGVLLPATNYNFTFESIVRKVNFSQNSLRELAVQLGEVRALSEVLIDAKINAIESLRREKVCAEDKPEEAASDYLDQKSLTNEMAVLRPYELTFRCFSTELAAALAGFANSSNGIIVKTLNYEPAPPSVTDPNAPTLANTFVQPVYTPATPASSAADAFARRYGIRRGPGAERMATPPPALVASPAAAARPATKSGLETVINEKPVKVTAMVYVVKLAPAADASGRPGGSGRPDGRGRRP